MPPSPTLPRREYVLLVAGAIALAVLMFWPLGLHLGTDIPKDLGDPLPQAWQVAWGGHALAHQPLDFFQSNQFWPLANTLAFSDALIGYAPAGLIGHGPTAAVVRYDLLFLLAYALALAGAYLLARELGAPPWAAAVAGAAFAFAPWRLEQNGHLHVISSGGIPLTLFLLLRGWRRRSPGVTYAGWLVATWQLSLGWTLGLPLVYLLGAAALVAAIAWWRRRPRPALHRPVVGATIAGVVTLAAVAFVISRPYVEVADTFPEAKRGPRTVAVYSGGPSMFAAAPAENLVWGRATAGVRDGLEAVPEQTLFPGLVILALALLGVGAAPWPRRVRFGLAGATLVVAVLSLGFADAAHPWRYPYGWLYEIGPGWQAIRVPTRLQTFTTLGLALLAAGGATWALARLRAGGHARAAAVVAPLLVLAVLVEGSGFGIGERGRPWLSGADHPRLPTAPAGLAGLPAPQLHLPAAAADNRRYLLWSTDGFPDLVNGRSSLNPPEFRRLVRAVRAFPDRTSTERLRRLGVRTVVLHADRVAGTPWAGWRRRPVAGLGLGREVRGRLVIYRLTTP